MGQQHLPLDPVAELATFFPSQDAPFGIDRVCSTLQILEDKRDNFTATVHVLTDLFDTDVLSISNKGVCVIWLVDSLADGALTTVTAKVCRADDLLTEKNRLNPSKPVYFRLHRNRENRRKKPRHPKMTRLS